MHLNSKTTASSAVASGGTLAFNYPTDGNGDATTAGQFEDRIGHKLWVDGHQRLYSFPADFTLSFGASSVTVTYNGTTAIPADSECRLQLDMLGPDDVLDSQIPAGAAETTLLTLDLGSPDASDADGICASQAGTASTAMTINGALASGGVATFDVPRNVVGAWTNTAVLTVVGTDVYGNVVSESSGSGTSMTGKKAFKTITSVTPSANITGATVGSSKVLGLPLRLPGTGYVLREMEDGAAPTAGTVVAGEQAVATATPGDVRGTYAPNSNPDGAKAFTLVVAGVGATDKGVAQFTG